MNKLQKKYEKIKNKSIFKKNLLKEVKTNCNLLTIDDKIINTKSYFDLENSSQKINQLKTKLNKVEYKKFNEKIENHLELSIFRKRKKNNLKLFKVDNKVTESKKDINLFYSKIINIKNIKIDNIKTTLDKKFIINKSSHIKIKRDKANIVFSKINFSPNFKKRSADYYKKLQLHKIKKQTSKIKSNKEKFKINFKLFD